MPAPPIGLDTRPLNPHFGVEVLHVDLRDVAEDHLYPEIRAAFEAQSVLLFREQSLTPVDHLALARLFGPIEDREEGEDAGEGAEEGAQSEEGRSPGGDMGADYALRMLDAQVNQLWHTDSTFLPTPALANVLAARAVPSSGGETEIASTRAAWRVIPTPLRAAAVDAVLIHRFSHSRARISPELAAAARGATWPDRRWRAIWRNPITGEEAPYLASHAYAVEGMEAAAGQAFIDALIDACAQPQYVYAHAWREGDVLIWDERATLHRARPWPEAEERVLSSLCVSATEADGLASVRVD